jgi:NAD(P)-dependent dehydrogenase (short-subunit alcohol dehydrogenase family)
VAREVVLITGASSGLGEAFAAHLARLGHRVYGTSRRGAFPAAGAEGVFPALVPMDVRDDASVRAAVDFVVEREGRLDVVVNNAGVGLAGAVEDTAPEEARTLFETNVLGVLRVCRAVMPILRSQGAGLIVNVGSIGGRIAIPFQGFYSASKFAVASLTDALRMEAKPFGVRVTLLEPGDFRTGFTDHRVVTADSRTNPAYRERCRSALQVMEHDERHGADPAALARLLPKLMTRRSPRARYVAGMFFQKLAVAIQRVLPPAWFERGLMAYYRIGPRAGRGAAPDRADGETAG